MNDRDSCDRIAYYMNGKDYHSSIYQKAGCCLKVGHDAFIAYALLCPRKTTFDSSIQSGDELFYPSGVVDEQIVNDLVSIFLEADWMLEQCINVNNKVGVLLKNNIFNRFSNLRGVIHNDLTRWRQKQTMYLDNGYPITEDYSGEGECIRQIGEMERLDFHIDGKLHELDGELKAMMEKARLAVRHANGLSRLLYEGSIESYYLVRNVDESFEFKSSMLTMNDCIPLAKLNDSGAPILLLNTLFDTPIDGNGEVKFDFKKVVDRAGGKSARQLLKESLGLDDVLLRVFARGTSGNSVIFRQSVSKKKLIDEGMTFDELRSIDIKLVEAGARLCNKNIDGRSLRMSFLNGEF